jgi:hypothetical protein
VSEVKDLFSEVLKAIQAVESSGAAKLNRVRVTAKSFRGIPVTTSVLGWHSNAYELLVHPLDWSAWLDKLEKRAESSVLGRVDDNSWLAGIPVWIDDDAADILRAEKERKTPKWLSLRYVEEVPPRKQQLQVIDKDGNVLGQIKGVKKVVMTALANQPSDMDITVGVEGAEIRGRE